MLNIPILTFTFCVCNGMIPEENSIIYIGVNTHEEQ